MASSTRLQRQTRGTGALVRMLANANLLPVAVLVLPSCYLKVPRVYLTTEWEAARINILTLEHE